jgi:predicted transcriptional regulator
MEIKVGQVWNYTGTSYGVGYKIKQLKILSVNPNTKTVRIEDTNQEQSLRIYRNRLTYAELISVYELDPVYKALEDFDSQLEELLDVPS